MDFDLNKLKTTFIYPTTPSKPIIGRKYTLTHCDITGIMFLDIGTEYNYSAINEELRDELFGRWVFYDDDNSYKLFFYAFVGGDNFSTALKRYNIFKSHMNMAIQAIIYGDRYLFKEYPQLINTPIYVKFDSDFPLFNNYESYKFTIDL